jgi:hypothetical protein
VAASRRTSGKAVRWLACVGLVAAGAGGCASLENGRGFTYAGTPIHCLNGIATGSEGKMDEIARSSIDLLASGDFQRRAAAVFAAPGARHGRQDSCEVRALDAHASVDRIVKAARAGFSLTTQHTFSGLTNAWDGSDDGECGRVIPLNRAKVAERPVYLWEGTVAHEMSHVAGFFHDGQEREGNECTYPHLVGDVAEWTAWEIARPAEDGTDKFVTWERVCTAFQVVCEADPHRRCQIGSAGVTPR